MARLLHLYGRSVERQSLKRQTSLAFRAPLRERPGLDRKSSLQSFEPPDVTTPSTRGDTLRAYQADGASWLRQNPCGLLADEMGLGKSVQALRALPDGATAVIVCPAGVRRVWEDECRSWRQDLDPVLSKLEAPPAKGQLLIVSYDSLPDPLAGVTRYLLPFSLRNVQLILDEAHLVKNFRAQRTRKVRLLSQQCAGCWVLTGTPLLGDPRDLWGILAAAKLEKKAFESWENFVRLFHATKKTITRGGPDGHKRTVSYFEFPDLDPEDTEVRDCLAPVMLRRFKRDVAQELPPKQYARIPVEVPPDLFLELGEVEAAWQLAGTDELPPFELLSRVRALMAGSRVDAMLEQVEAYEAAKVPLVLFSAHKTPIEALAGREGWGTITGATSPEVRRTLVDCFQSGLLHGLALTIQAGGVGITLTRSSNVLFVDRSFTPADNAQAEDRVHRIGQAGNVQIAIMMSDHIVDRRLQEILDRKQRLITASVG